MDVEQRVPTDLVHELRAVLEYVSELRDGAGMCEMLKRAAPPKYDRSSGLSGADYRQNSRASTPTA